MYNSNPDMDGQFFDAILVNRNPDCRTYTMDANNGNYGSHSITDLSNGITDARSLARMYASLIGDGVDGVRLFNDETVTRASAEQVIGRDQVVGVLTRFGLGFSLYRERSNMVQDGVFGHGGAGGSLGFADPKADIGFGYVMNKMQMVGDDDPRTVGLTQAVHASLKG